MQPYSSCEKRLFYGENAHDLSLINFLAPYLCFSLNRLVPGRCPVSLTDQIQLVHQVIFVYDEVMATNTHLPCIVDKVWC